VWCCVSWFLRGGGGGGARFIPPEEYKEFLSLGHGGVFDLDLDNVDVAPWRAPGADVSAYFNHGFTEHTWREYTSSIRHVRLELTMNAGRPSLPPSVRHLTPESVPQLRLSLQPEAPVTFGTRKVHRESMKAPSMRDTDP